ncbi:MAG: hypothetical protein ACI9EF_002385 [Pseudohongiellaceae bacterium]|jgi:hypothetical protein
MSLAMQQSRLRTFPVTSDLPSDKGKSQQDRSYQNQASWEL